MSAKPLLPFRWSPAIDEQAFDRVHRIGQTRPVTIYKFVIRDSIEERIEALQQHKAKLAQGALSFKQTSDIRLGQLVRLLE